MSKAFMRGVIHLVCLALLGIMLASKYYCAKEGITSGPMFLDWESVATVLFGLIGVQLLMKIDPTYRD
jgi:hypothetical protein